MHTNAWKQSEIVACVSIFLRAFCMRFACVLRAFMTFACILRAFMSFACVLRAVECVLCAVECG